MHWTFDPTYVFAPNQGISGIFGVRFYDSVGESRRIGIDL